MSAAIPAVTVRAWRDYDDEARTQPGMFLGELSLGADPLDEVPRLVDAGARKVQLTAPVRLADDFAAGTVTALSVVRDLTGHGAVVDWQLDTGGLLPQWRVLSHLYPPSRLTGMTDASAVLSEWRRLFYICKCVYRRGPGFLEVRDRRWDGLARFTVDDPEYVHSFATLDTACHTSDIPSEIAGHLAAEGLVVPVDTHLWLAPYRVRRWPFPAFIV